MKLTVTTILTLFALNAFGQQFSGSREITLDDAIKLALEKNYSSRQAILQLEQAQYGRSKAGDALLPSANGTASYGYHKGLTSVTTTDYFATPITTTTAVPDATHTLSYSVGASFNIYNGGFDAASISSSESQLDAARYNLKWTRQSVAYNTIAAYMNALRTRELLRSAQTTYSQDSAQLVRVQAQFDAGAVAINSVYQQQAVVGQDELQRIQSQNNYDNAVTDLLFLLDIPPSNHADYDLSLKGVDTSVTGIASRANQLKSDPTMLADLLNHREDLAAQRANIQSQEEGISVTRSALLPSLNANIGIGGSGTNTNISNIPLSHALTGGLTLSVPIFDRMQTRIQLDIQRTQLDESKVQLDQAEQQFRSDIAKAENNLRSAQQALSASDRALVAAEESLRAATERARVGAGIQVDVIVAEAQAQTARVNRINAVYNYLLAAKQLEYLLGRTNY